MYPVAITRQEGGMWFNFVPGMGGTFHAIVFDDGSILDTVNGWRAESVRNEIKHRVRVKMGRAIV